MFRCLLACGAFQFTYILLSLCIGETHPFSREEMYNSFPNSAVTLYLSDSLGHVIPISHYFHYNADKITHNYHNIVEKTGGYKPYDEIRYAMIGQLMWQQIVPHKINGADAGLVYLHLVEYQVKNNQIVKTDHIINKSR